MKQLYLFITSLIVGVVLFVPAVAQADVNDFVIREFYGTYVLKNDAPGGRMMVTEKIDLTFSDQNHGILRSIPTKNSGKDVGVRFISAVRDGQTEQYTTSKDGNNNLIAKIGDPNRTITGEHTYVLTYELKRSVISFFEDKTEWYWDINGTDWAQPFEKVGGEVIFPNTSEAFKSSGTSCYTGREGATGTKCQVTPTAKGFRFETTAPLAANENLTVATEVPGNIFTPYTTKDWLRDNLLQLVGVPIGLVLFLLALAGWLKYGRDYSGRGTIVPEYQPPKDMSPAEVGLIHDYDVQGRDISATLIDLAVRGFVVISDNSRKYFGFITLPDFGFILKRTDKAGLKSHEIAVLKLIFGEQQQLNQTVSMRSINQTAAGEIVKSLREKLITSLTTEASYFEPAGKKWQTYYFVFAFVCAFLAFLAPVRPGWTISLVVGTASFVLFGIFMQRRSHLGVDAYEKIEGFKLYMKTAEADRLKMLQGVERPYAPPEKTYDLFEKLLPFAIALGVEKSWAKQFDGLFSQAPGWYQGNAASNFSSVAFASSFSNSMSGLSQTFASQSGSSSSGSGGGGSSGGGGGGGGGGGW